jgi:hypothetical protein
MLLVDVVLFLMHEQWNNLGACAVGQSQGLHQLQHQTHYVIISFV